MRPITDTRDMSVLHRIEMDIIDMPGEIVLVANGVLPESPLPDATLISVRTAG